MDQVSFEEIVSILARNGRPDLIDEFRENVKIDEDYKPPNFMKREKYSDDIYTVNVPRPNVIQ